MTSEPQISSDQPALCRDPLINYLGPHCERVLDSGEPPTLINQTDSTKHLVSMIVTDSEGGSETTITAIKEEPLEPESCREELENFFESDVVNDEAYVADAFLEESKGPHWNLRRIFTELNTNEQCIIFAIERGLLPTKKICRRHRKPMRLDFQNQKNKNDQKRHLGLGVFRCKRDCTRSKSRVTGTWFENLKMPLNNLFQIMYMFCHKYSYLDIKKQTTRDDGSTVSSSSIALWYANCREAIIVYHLEHRDAENKIGGPGKIVCIEQSKMGERNFRISKHIGGQWVVGLMEKGNDDVRLELCADNQESAQIVIPMIVQKHVEPGTEIHTDTFIANHCLSQEGFKHITSKNKSGEENNAVEPVDSNWKRIKAIFKRDRFQGNFTDWLIEYSWRRNIKASNKCAFEELLKAVQYSY